MEQTNPVIQEVESGLESRLSNMLMTRGPVRALTVAEILNLCDRQTERRSWRA